MTDIPPQTPEGRRPSWPPSPGRITVWIVVGAIGVFLLGSGIMGILVKG